MNEEELSPLDVRAIQDLQKSYNERLTSVREVAGKWQGGLAAVITGFSALLVVTGRETFEKLNEDAQIWAGVWLGAAILASVLGAVLGIGASAGWPVAFNLEDAQAKATKPGELFVAINAWRSNRFKWSRRALLLSLLLTVASIGFFLASLAVTWYSPDAKQPPATSCVLLSVGEEEIARWTIGEGSIQVNVAGQLRLETCPE